jgi:cell division cycle protein 37
MESADPDHDQPPPRPEGVHTDEKELPTYSKMIATLIDQVKNEVGGKKPSESEKLSAYVTEVKGHKAKVTDLQRQLEEKLKELELAESRKITSESIHTGFDSSSVNKSKPPPSSSINKKPISAGAKPKVQAVEVLNPHALQKQSSRDSGVDADVDEPIASLEGDESDEEEHHATELGKKFANIRIGDYRTCLNFISEHPDVVTERETDGLLIIAFDSELSGKADFAKQCVHQALLLQYCRTLGRDGVGLFFKRITTAGHQAQKVFTDDVTDTYQRIRKRAKEILKEREKEEEAGGVEQIQLHAVEPGTEIRIFVPPKELSQSGNEEEKRSREIFEAFPPGLQRALQSGKLEEVNKVLGKMSVDEAEEIVGQLSEGGMLSLGEQIIDTTTEEGQAELKRLEEEERQAKDERESAIRDAADLG